jgi:succinyl-diaminopimelate desuccinylase
VPEERPEEVECELRGVIEAAAGASPAAAVAIRRLMLAPPLVPLPGGLALTELICAHATRGMGEAVVAGGVPLYTDARHYAAAGVPVVLYGAGPHSIEEANAHRADERLKLADLYRATEVVALTLADFLAA